MLKDISAEQLAAANRAVAQGQILLHPEVASAVLDSLSTPVPLTSTTSVPSEPDVPEPAITTAAGVGMVAQLTEREREILTLLARGSSDRKIFQSLYIASGTVKSHLSIILGKLGVRDRTQAALKARELGLL